MLYDENTLDANTIEKITHYLTFVFARCTRSISVPAPCRYADLAAYRARIHLYEIEKIPNLSDEKREAMLKKAIQVDPALRDLLYYA